MRRDILICLPSPSMRCSGAAHGVGLVSYRDRLWILRAIRSLGALRPPLKKMLFPVQRPGDFITAEWELFFFILPSFFGQDFIIFLQKKTEKI